MRTWGSMNEQYTLKAIGWVSSERLDPIDDHWDSVHATIHLDESRFNSEALLGLGDFSHVEVIFIFHRVGEDQVTMDARHPRGRKDWPRIGIFAQRGKNRPNRLGVTICKIIEVTGNTIVVQGLDAIDGTPILDVKPVLSGFAPRGEFYEPEWSKEIMQEYW